MLTSWQWNPLSLTCLWKRDAKVKDLLNASLFSLSASNATIALAEKLVEVRKFCQDDESQTQEWNISDATIVNATGTDIRLLDGSLKTTNTEEESWRNF